MISARMAPLYAPQQPQWQTGGLQEAEGVHFRDSCMCLWAVIYAYLIFQTSKEMPQTYYENASGLLFLQPLRNPQLIFSSQYLQHFHHVLISTDITISIFPFFDCSSQCSLRFGRPLFCFPKIMFSYFAPIISRFLPVTGNNKIRSCMISDL